jgi:hypothetical protein
MTYAEVDAKSTRRDRLAWIRRASWAERTAFHEEVAARKKDAIAARIELGRSYLAKHAGRLAVPRETAVGQLALEAETRAAREEAVRKAEAGVSQYNNGSLEFPVLAHEFEPDSPSLKLGFAPEILAPIVGYLGMWPVLFNMFVTRAHQQEILSDSPHSFHLDPEDVISFKAFVHLTDVDDDCGPFHALPAQKTQAVLSAVDYRGIARLKDEQVADVVGWDSVKKFTGPPGTVALADTTRCLHFGGRPRKDGKPVRDMLVFQYLLPTSPLLGIPGEFEGQNFFPQLKPTGDPHWDALIGASLT